MSSVSYEDLAALMSKKRLQGLIVAVVDEEGNLDVKSYATSPPKVRFLHREANKLQRAISWSSSKMRFYGIK